MSGECHEEDESVPSESGQVTAEWLSRALNIKVNPDTLKCIPANIHEPPGFLTNILRIHFTKNNQQGEAEECHLIAKLLPLEESSPAHRQLVISHKLHLNEIYFYSKILPDILKVLPELSNFLPPFLYGNVDKDLKNEENGGEILNGVTKNASILLLEDLKARGYERKPFHQQMAYDEFDQGIIFLAKFHYAATAFEGHKKMKLPELYPWLPKWYRPNPDPLIQRLLIQESFPLGFDQLEKFLPETHRHAFVDLKRNAGKIFDKVLEAGQEFPTGIHGALWQNNLIVQTKKSETEGQQEEVIEGQEIKGEGKVKVIDWEMMGYADPLFDLAIYILSCFPEEHLSIMSVELTILRYTEEFNKLIQEKTELEGEDFGLSLKIRSDFHENLQFFNTYGLSYAFIWFTMSSDSILKVKVNEERLLNIFKFLHDDMDLPAFLYSIL